MNKIVLNAVGSDPEFFIRDTKKEEYVSSEGIIGGTKKKPRIVSAEGHAVQEDNVMVEVNFPPSPDPETFIRHKNFMLDYLNRFVEKINPDYMIRIDSSATFDQKFLNSEQANEIGCEPDRNAWFDMDNPSPDVVSSNKRYAGGHIHISYNDPTPEKNIQLVKAMDMFLGLPAVIMDTDDDRKNIYGTPGRYRNKSYGFEYRTLSNFWLVDDNLIHYVFSQVQKAIDFVNGGNQVLEDVPVIIDTINKEKANEFIQQNGISVIQNNFVSERLERV